MKTEFICRITLLIILLHLLGGCSGRVGGRESNSVVLFDRGAYPSVMRDGDMYYYVMQDTASRAITIYAAASPEALGKARAVTVWPQEGSEMRNIWSPELTRIGSNWYIYFEADRGNTDDHNIYVLENTGSDPLQGDWTLHGPVITDDECNFGIHPSTLVVGGRQYLFWSGWETRRIGPETQCIFITEMADPWTPSSRRIMISRPEYEWERQWINPDGSRSAYPIFVNENPQPALSPDSTTIVVLYSASGIWTMYNTLGMLHAHVGDNLLNPTSWVKEREPIFTAEPGSGLFGTSNVSLCTRPDGGQFMVYQIKSGLDIFTDCHIRLKPFTWEGPLPDLGRP